LHFLTATDSTNSEAERRLAGDEETPFVILAVRQERGRGRLGRPWFSEDEGNIHVSFAFRPELRPAAMQLFTLWMGVNVCEALANACRVDIGVKWPNDLLHLGRKLGGMLTEARIDADHTRDVIFGLGLNLNSQRHDWPPGIAPLATSVSEALGHSVDMNRVTATVISRVLKAYETFVAGEYRSDFERLWKRFDVLTGRKITVMFGDRQVTGEVEGIDSSGTLRLRDARGKVHQYLAGDVTIEKSGL
jgi:BirA family biotin operon repressor/biotin-[acetyl-CoA-carboxylase] ligase